MQFESTLSYALLLPSTHKRSCGGPQVDPSLWVGVGGMPPLLYEASSTTVKDVPAGQRRAAAVNG